MTDPELLYSSADHKRLTNMFHVQVVYMQFVGQIPIRFDSWLPKRLGALGRFLSLFYCAFLIFQSAHTAALYLKTTLDTLENGVLEDISDAGTSLLIYSFSTFASCYWLWLSKPLIAFLERINHFHQHHSLAGLTYVSSYNSYRKARLFIISWMLACTMGVVCWGLAPLILRVRILPLNCWYPFDAKQPFVYELIYILQLHAQIVMGNVFGTAGSLLVASTMVLLGQFDVLYCSLKNFEFHARLMSGEDFNKLRAIQRLLPHPDNDELNQYIISEEHPTDSSVLLKLCRQAKHSNYTLREAQHHTLVKCVQHHQFLLESCDKLKQLFSPYCLVKSLQITVQLCLLVFVAVESERSVVRILILIQYVSLTFFELLMFTYCGELLRSHSVHAGDAFWRSNWYEFAPGLRKDVLIFLSNSRRAIRLTAGHFFVMDVERLRLVVTQAISFLTLLQKLAEKKQN